MMDNPQAQEQLKAGFAERRRLPKGRGVAFALYNANEPIDKVFEGFRRRYGQDPQHVAKTGGGILAGPLPAGRKHDEAMDA